jgi:hypothetical protein
MEVGNPQKVHFWVFMYLLVVSAAFSKSSCELRSRLYNVDHEVKKNIVRVYFIKRACHVP